MKWDISVGPGGQPFLGFSLSLSLASQLAFFPSSSSPSSLQIPFPLLLILATDDELNVQFENSGKYILFCTATQYLHSEIQLFGLYLLCMRCHSIKLILFLLFYAEQVCYTGNGNDYRGDIKITESGKMCQDWTLQTPHKHDYTPLVYVL